MFPIVLIKYICFAGLIYQLFLIITNAPMQYPLFYRIGISVFWLIGFMCYIFIQKNYMTSADMFVNKIMTFTKRVYEECKFMHDVNQGTINAMKKTIIKTNDQKKLEILERKYRILESQDKLLESQLELNKKVDDGMHELTKVEQELANYDCADK